MTIKIPQHETQVLGGDAVDFLQVFVSILKNCLESSSDAAEDVQLIRASRSRWELADCFEIDEAAVIPKGYVPANRNVPVSLRPISGRVRAGTVPTAHWN